MAQIANLVEPVTISAVEWFQPLPIGPLLDVDPVTSVSSVGSPIANRFPVPPSAAAFLTDVDALLDASLVFDGLTTPYIFTGALFPGSPFLEPTIGQIWPRTG
jgi:hypothetical protein